MRKFVFALCLLSLIYQANVLANDSTQVKATNNQPPGPFETLEANNSQWQVKLMSLTPAHSHSTPDHHIANLLIQQKSTGVQREHTVETAMTIVNSIAVYKDKLVMIGSMGTLANGFMILDLNNQHQPEFVLCYQPELSPSKRYIVYKMHYPRFAPSQYTSESLLIYDLQKTAQENTLLKSAKLSDPFWKKSASDAGHFIYPENKAHYSAQVNREPVIIKSPYLWQQDERNLVVLIEKRDRSSSPEILKFDIDKSGQTRLIKQVDLSPYLEKYSAQLNEQAMDSTHTHLLSDSRDSKYFKISGLSLSDHGMIDLELNGIHHITIDIGR